LPPGIFAACSAGIDFKMVNRRPKYFHEKAGVGQACFFFLAAALFGLSRAASVAILPSALFVERFSLGASWASSFQQVLLPDNRP
jgi:hypothetical protein